MLQSKPYAEKVHVLKRAEPAKLAKKPAYLSIRSSKTFILSTVALASFSDTFLYSIVTPVFPTSLHERAHVAIADVQMWLSILLSIYGGALLIGAPITGIILDNVQSRRTPFLWGILVLAAATALLCVGTSLPLLIVGRIVSGAAAAIVWTGSAAMITANIEEESIGTALGIVALALNMGSLVGPILGGVVFERAGYYAVFGMAFGVLGADAVLRVLVIEKSDAAKWISADSVPISGRQNSDVELNAPWIPIDAVVETQVDQEVTPPKQLPKTLRLLSSYRILITVGGSFVMSCLLAAFETVLPLFVEREFGFTSTGAGLIFLPLVIPSLCDPLIGHICDKRPKLTRYIAAGGFIGALPPLVLLRLVKHGGTEQVVLLCALLAIIGLCVTITSAPLMFEVNLGVLEVEKQDPMILGKKNASVQGYGLFVCAFAGGSIVGPLLAGYLKDGIGWGAMAWCLGLLSGVTAIPVLLLLGGWIGNKR